MSKVAFIGLGRMELSMATRLDASVVAKAIASGQAASPQVVRNTHRIVEGNHDRDVVFTPALRLKDVRYACPAIPRVPRLQLLVR